MRRRSWTGEPCCVPNCYRRSKKEVPFCERCWSAADDGERAQVQFAQHAPFFRPYLHKDDGDVRWSELGIQQPPTWQHRYWTIGDNYAGLVLQEFEARSTREAVARAIAQRRRLGADVQLEEEAA